MFFKMVICVSLVGLHLKFLTLNHKPYITSVQNADMNAPLYCISVIHI